jgi:hypothetical protein
MTVSVPRYMDKLNTETCMSLGLSRYVRLLVLKSLWLTVELQSSNSLCTAVTPSYDSLV